MKQVGGREGENGSDTMEQNCSSCGQEGRLGRERVREMVLLVIVKKKQQDYYGSYSSSPMLRQFSLFSS